MNQYNQKENKYRERERIVNILNHYHNQYVALQLVCLMETKYHVGHAILNIVTRGEHVGSIKRLIRIMKERTISSYQGVPFKQYTALIVDELVLGVTSWLYSLPNEDGIDLRQSPNIIVL